MKVLSILASVACIVCTMLSSCGSNGAASQEKVDLIPVTTSKDGKWSMVNNKGEVVYDSEFKNCPTAAYNGLFNVEENNGYTVYKIGGKTPEAVAGLEGLKDVGYLEDGLIPVSFPGKRISVADENGKIKFELNPVRGEEVQCCAPGYSEGMLWFKTENDNYGFIDKSGKVAIQPTYHYVDNFSEGLALAVKANDEKKSEKTIIVIDKNGKEVFKFKEDYELVTTQFKHGYLLARNDGRFYIIDKKGKEKKLSSKIASVYNFNKRFIIYRSEDGDMGVMDFNDQIIIRPKYSDIIFGNGDFFIVKKDFESKSLVKIDLDGEESSDKIDYKEIFPFGKFGYFAKEGKIIELLNDKFVKKGKEEFFDINLNWDRGYVNTDYLDYNSVAKSVVKLIDGNGVAGLSFGATPSQLLKGKTPRAYAWDKEVKFQDLTIKGFRYQIDVTGIFSDYVTNSSYFLYEWTHKWNPSSKLVSVGLLINAQSKWSKEGHEAIKQALTDAGYKLIKDGKIEEDSSFASLFEKDNYLVSVESRFDDKNAYLIILNNPEGQYTFALDIQDLDGSELTNLRKKQPNERYSEELDSCVEVIEAVPVPEDSVLYIL